MQQKSSESAAQIILGSAQDPKMDEPRLIHARCNTAKSSRTLFWAALNAKRMTAFDRARHNAAK
jgi:hypothetical protein